MVHYILTVCLEIFYVREMKIDTVERLLKSGARGRKPPKLSEVVRDIRPEHWKLLLKTWDSNPVQRLTVRKLIDQLCASCLL